jgi:putative nucleotidyltransferase with HDIG domain
VRFQDSPLPRPGFWARRYPAVVTALGAVVLVVSIAAMISAPPDFRWVVLAVLTIASAQLMLRMPAAVPISFSISDIFTFSGALMFGPATGAMLAGVDAALLSMRLERTHRSFSRFMFNVSAASLAMWAASSVFFALAAATPLAAHPSDVISHVAPLAAFALIYYVLNTGLVAVAVALGGRRTLWSVWREHFMPLWPGYAGGAFGAGLAVFLLSAEHGNPGVLAFVLPIPFILYVTFKTAVGRMHDEVTHLTRVNSMYVATIETLAQAVDARDEVTHDHLRRVQTNAMGLAQLLNVTDESALRAIEAAALLHDVGKLAIPEHILNKPDKLTPAEFEVMKMHAKIGADILSPIGFPFPVVPIVRHHHENWDGTGYPDGLHGEQIPIGARILSVVDCFDALTSDRPYRRAFSVEKAIAIIRERSGVMYDPKVVDALIANKDEIAAHVEQGSAAAATVTETIAHARQAARTDDAAVSGVIVNLAGRLGEIVGRHRDLDALCRALDDELSRRLPGMTIVVYQYDPQLDGLFARAAAGVHGEAVEGLTIGLGLRLTGWVGAHRTTIANSEAALDLGNIASQLRPLPHLCLSTPIVDDERLAGVLTLYSTTPAPFTGTDVALVEMLARLMAPRLGTHADVARGAESAAVAARVH